MLGTHVIIIPASTQHGEKLVRIVHMCTEVSRTDVGLPSFRSGETLRGNQRCSESDRLEEVPEGARVFVAPHSGSPALRRPSRYLSMRR